MSTSPIIFHRTGAETDWSCRQKRFWANELYGTGVNAPESPYELYLGTLIHDGVAAMVHDVSIDRIVEAGTSQLRAKLLEGREMDSDAQFLAEEQCALAEGLLRGFYRAHWPRILDAYPELVLVEKDLPYDYEIDGRPLRFVSKADLVRRDKDGQLWVFEWKTTGSIKEEWINSWQTAAQVHAQIKVVEQHLGETVAGCIVQGFYKSYVSQWNRLESIFCLTPETKVLTGDLRYVPIGSLQEGDDLVGFDEYPVKDFGWDKSRRYWRKSKVQQLRRIKQPCVKLTFEDGRTVTCSKQHLWLTSTNKSGCNSTKDTQWRTADSLVARKSRIIALLPTWEHETSHASGYLAGIFDGEGHLSHQHPKGQLPSSVIGFSQKPGTILNAVKRLLEERNLTVTGPYRDSGRSAAHLNISKRHDVMQFLGSIRPSRLLTKLNLDRFGGLSQHRPPLLITKIEDVGVLGVVAIETSTRTLVAEGLASHNCYAYHHPGNPPWEKPRWAYEYKAGLKKYPVWNREGGVKQWVEEMPLPLLQSQFPQTPPIFVNQVVVDDFFQGQGLREIEIRDHRPDDPFDPANKRVMMQYFPKMFTGCNAYNRVCGYKRLCFGSPCDPLSIGYEARRSHHQLEQESIDAAQ